MQIHTGGECCMDAAMTKAAISEFDTKDLDVVFLENVGNLVCTAEQDTGANINIEILSVPEGDDKPLKYPLMFSKADVVVVNKIDAIEAFDFSPERFKQYVAERAPGAPVFTVSAATGEGIIALSEWIGERTREILEYID
jgi:hydrogenase nickel incorporation protein HypB